MMLLAPNTRWAVVNLCGSVGGKYGASTHLSMQRRRKILHAAQGLSTTMGALLTVPYWAGGETGDREVEEFELLNVVAVVAAVSLEWVESMFCVC